MAKRYTYQDVKEIVEKANYELISSEEEIVNKKGFVLTGIKTKVWCKNPNHKAEDKKLSDFIRGTSRCRKCKYEKHAEKLKHSIEYIKEEFEKEGYKLISTEYKNNHQKLNTICPKGHRYDVTFACFQNGDRCCHCYNEIRNTIQSYSTEEISLKVKEKGYELLSEYKNNHTKIILKCPNGHLWKTDWSSFQQGYECPYCNTSKGEKRILNILDKLNIESKSQYTFEDCKFYNVLPFDFYLPQYNILIEYDGIQHFEPIDFAGKGKEWAMNRFIDCIIRDTIKNEYCKKNNIKLIRISYWDFDKIEEILKLELKQ